MLSIATQFPWLQVIDGKIVVSPPSLIVLLAVKPRLNNLEPELPELRLIQFPENLKSSAVETD
jgi:hypothetical protein